MSKNDHKNSKITNPQKSHPKASSKNSGPKTVQSGETEKSVAATKALKQKSLRSRILPTSGYFCIFVKDSKADAKKTSHHWFGDRKSAFNYISNSDEKGVELFIAQASFAKKGTLNSGRSQGNASYLRNFFMDIDCGHGKPYSDQTEAEQALISFCKKAGLPIPAIVNSGNGLYAHWPLTTEIAANIWTPVAMIIKRLVVVLEPGLDSDGLITDSARVLRPIGSTHRKDPKNPKVVTLLCDCESIEFESFKLLLDKAASSLPTMPIQQDKLFDLKDKDTDKNISSAADMVAEKCPVIYSLREKRGEVSEPLWYACIGVLRHCAESPEIIHDFSKGHSGYSRKETDAKIAQHNFPPTTCKHFAELCPEICKECEHFGKVKSPITLGMTTFSIEIPDYIQKMNSEYFVARFGGKTIVCRHAYDVTLKRRLMETSSFQDIRNLFNNQKVTVCTDKNGNPTFIPLGNAWLDHEGRRQYMDVKMMPEGAPEGVYNLWQGFSVKQIKGSWKLMRKHIRRVICNSDTKLYDYLIGWLARMIQQPWAPGEVALVLQGGKGVGKGMLGNAICRIMGQHGCHVMNVKNITGDFNGHLEDCVFLFADEAFWAGDKAAEGVLKGMITEPTIMVTYKHCNSKQARNMLHILMASNSDWVVPASTDERRFCVLKVSDRYAGDSAYFKALVHETENGGLEAMLFYLVNLDISNFNVRTVPKTVGLTEQKIMSLESVLRWWYEKLQDGELLPGYRWGTVPCKGLYDDYVSGVQKLGGNIRRATDTSFGIKLKQVLPDGWPKKSRESSKNAPVRTNHYSFPDQGICRKHFQKVLGAEDMKWE